jgi:sugar phosphate isomerase/epimerase
MVNLLGQYVTGEISQPVKPLCLFKAHAQIKQARLGGEIGELPLSCWRVNILSNHKTEVIMLSLTTDYKTGIGCPELYLRHIAEHGFTHVHWCHQWDTDFLYCEAEIKAIEGWMRDYHLGLTDVHASHGHEKNWVSALEYERLAGLELVINRMQFAARLGSDVIILHLPQAPKESAALPGYWDLTRRTLDALQPQAQRYGVRIALENLDPGHLATVEQVFKLYSPEYIGLCYDSGHGNLAGDGLDWLEKMGERLISLHLHDNNGAWDEHKLPFTGTVDWDRLTRALARSTYGKWISMELVQGRTGIEDEEEFLFKAYNAGIRLHTMVEGNRMLNTRK